MNLLEIKKLLENQGCKTAYLCDGVVVFNPARQHVMDFLCRINLAYNKDFSKAWVRISGLEKNMILRRNTESAIDTIMSAHNKAVEQIKENNINL